jgi:hypothetical protein
MNPCVVTFQVPQQVDQPQPEVIHLVLKKMPEKLQVLAREVLDLALDDLQQIADAYKDLLHLPLPYKTDLLSNQLLDWCIDVIFDDGYSEMLDEQYINTLTKKIQKLTNEILVNPLDRAPLEEPLIVDQSLWEKWMWEDFNQLSPMPNRVVMEHSFAAAIIRWRKSLPIAELKPSIDLKNTPFFPLQAKLPPNAKPFFDREMFQNSNDEASKVLKLFAYCQQASNALVVQKVDNLSMKTERATSVSRGIWEESRKKIAAHDKIAKLEAEKHRMNINNILDNIQNSHQAEVKVLGTLINSLHKQIQDTRKRLEASEQKCVLHEHQIRHLRQVIANEQARVDQLQKKGKKSRKFGIF